MVILGLNAYHGDAAAAILVDGELIAAVEEERLNRVKHSAGFPRLAARWCLDEVGIKPQELDHVAISRNPRANLPHKILRAARTPSTKFLRARLSNAARVHNVKAELATAVDVSETELRAEFHHVEHHQTHVASAFFVSPFEEAAILSIDGFGDFVSTMLAHGKGNSFSVLDRVLFPHSLGLFYMSVTQWLGFPKYGDEGKVMGLAPYGTPRYTDELQRLVDSDSDLFSLDLDYFDHHRKGVDMTWDSETPTIGPVFSDRLCEMLGPPRAPGSPLEDLHNDVAASLQVVFEGAYLRLLETLWQKTQVPNLCLAGGVALNAVANGLIRSRTPFDDFYIQPAAGDSGTAVGAAYHVWNGELGKPRSFVMDHAYFGPQYSNDQIRTALDEAGLTSRLLDDDELVGFAADHIAAGEVVGWFQGRMEFGPRALGNRSIVADPRRHDMKDILNARIKHREAFRPFAPSVLAERAADWYEDGHESPFMIVVFNTREGRRELIPAVDHVDGTGRVQTVTKEANPRYYRLIEAFAERTDTPVVLNTSFNENEPIVCTPEEAINCFTKTSMDVLVLGNHVVERSS
jgi:carbamoyltransferase